MDATYKIKVTDIVLSGTGNKVQLAIRSGATPYDSTYLIYIGERYYTQDTDEITFTIPENIKATAKYIGVTSFTAYESASFKVALSYDGLIDRKIADATTPINNSLNNIGRDLFELRGIIDAGTTYSEKYGTTNRTCAFYEIPDVNAKYRIRVSNVTVPSGVNLLLALRSGTTPYQATFLGLIGDGRYTQDTGYIDFAIPDSIKATAKYISVCQESADSGTCSFDVELTDISSDVPGLQVGMERLQDDVFNTRGIIDKGTSYSDKYGTTNRTCAFYEIPNVDDKYRINVKDVVVPSGINLLLAIRSDKTPYSATFLGLIGDGRYTQDTGDITFEIPNALKSTAKYISVCQEAADSGTCSFKVSLFDASADIQRLQEEIDEINSVIGDIESGEPIVDKIPYNDSIFVGGRLIRIYNPYKDGGNNQYTGQTHCHSWSYVKSGGVTYKVPIGYTVEQIAAMTEEQRAAAVESVNQQFVAAHKTVGYDFMTITNYDTFADYTPKPQVFPENFLWLCNGFEGNTGGWDSSGQAEDRGAHIVILNTDFGKIFDGYAPKDVISYCEERNAVASYAHPFLNMLYSSPDYVKQIKCGLRFIEVFNSLGVYHADVGGVPYVKPGIELDEDFDALLSQGNYIFCMAVSDQRNLGTTEVERNHLKEGCIKVFATGLTNKEIWAALLSGNFYATENVDAELTGISLSDNVLTINVGVAGRTVEFVKEGNVVVSTVVTTSGDTTASYTITGNEKFIRARIYQAGSPKTNRIWTQPIFLAPRIID